jgi:predicted lipid-binding transport protein (Tim44 family)
MRSPFAQGLAGGLLGGFVGSLLFGGSGHAATTGGGSSGIGLMDLVLIGALLYFLMRFLKRRREQAAMASSAYRQASVPDYSAMPRTLEPARGAAGDTADARAGGDLERGFDQIRQFDANFSEERFKETAQDIFFCIQAAWMRRDLKGAENLVTEEMAAWMGEQYASLRDKGHINRLENIAVRKVELTEAWQESGMEFVTVLLTANLLDYTVDEKTGAVVAGDRDQPVKFEEFWTFTRSIGTPQWRLSAIHQAE